jgi:hypothetical protein
VNQADVDTVPETTTERLTEADYLHRAQCKAIGVATEIRARDDAGSSLIVAALIEGGLDQGIIEMFEAAKEKGWYALLQDAAKDIVMAAAVCQDPKRALFYTTIAGLARGDYHDDLIRFIKGAKP